MDQEARIPAWEPSMALGIDAIDQAHQELYAALHALEQQPDARFSEAYADVVAAIERDFREEESLMETLDYPSLPAHREQHARVLAGLHHVSATADGGDPAPARHAVALFAQWMSLHQQTMDAALALALQLAGKTP